MPETNRKSGRGKEQREKAEGRRMIDGRKKLLLVVSLPAHFKILINICIVFLSSKGWPGLTVQSR